MAEYGVVLAVVTLAVVASLTLLADNPPRCVREHRRHVSPDDPRPVHEPRLAGESSGRFGGARPPRRPRSGSRPRGPDPRFLLVVPLVAAGFWFYRRRHRDDQPADDPDWDL